MKLHLKRLIVRTHFKKMFFGIGLWVSLAVSSTVKPLPFAFWLGAWEGEIKVYSATGDLLEVRHVSFSSSMDQAHSQGVQKISLVTQSSKRRDIERQDGCYLIDVLGLRKILRNEKGELLSDLRGRLLGPSKIYWFNVDCEGVLREVLIESSEGDAVRVHGFRWDGQRSGSYRIIDACYERQKNAEHTSVREGSKQETKK